MPSMDHGPPDTKRARTTGPSWSVGGAHQGVSLLHPTPSPTTTAPLPHHPPTAHSQYQPPPPLPPHPPPPSHPSHPPHPPHPSHPPHPPHPPHPGHPQQQQQQQQPPPPTYSRPPGPGDHHLPPPPPPPLSHPSHPSQHPPPHDDRRHHEPDRYPPMQEQRQPPHSPVHPYPGYPPRVDPLVKPDPADDTLPHLRRPLSTGNSHDSMTPGTPHAPQPPGPPPHSHSYPDDKRHLSFDNGPPPPHMYRQPSYPPPTPLPHPQSYDYPPSYGTPHPDSMYPISYTSSAAGKRKAQRASQACDSCRQLKAKCDELKPCKSCKEKKVECKYREAVPKQQDKMAADILDLLIFLRDDVRGVTQEFRAMNQRVARLEQRDAASGDVPAMAPDHDDRDRAASAESPAPMAEEAYTYSPGETTLTANQAPIGIVEARNTIRNMEEEMEAEPGPHVRPGVPAIPLNHTTLAALLLKWQSIESLVQRYLDAENVRHVEEFPIQQEQRRGLLRVWGRGEGFDSNRGDRESPHDLGMMEINDDQSDAGAPSPADCWGGISGSPGPGEGKLPASPPLDFNDATVWKYVKSYQDNIQNMHPLIIPVELNAMVKLFLDSLHTSNKRPKLSYSGEPTVAKFAYNPSSMAIPHAEVGSKRKRSSPERDGTETPSKVARPTFQRSINNALVLLVLALGKICLHKDKKIPDVVPVRDPSHGSPLVRNGYPASPTQGSPPAFPPHHHSSGLPSPKEAAERSGSSRRPSFQGAGVPPMKSGYSHKRNLDVIPGLDYFAYATDILGGHMGGTTLRHIQAWILAGLYHGQLGRVMESYAYIKEAGLALQIKMRPSLDRFKKLQENMPSHLNAIKEKSDNQLVFAFWTTLQLESDIIAELPLPQSHILAFEEIMPYPNTHLAGQHGFDDHVLQSYLAQLYLRKNLNQIHQMLYNPENTRPLHNFIEHIQNSLDMRFVPEAFQFQDNDPPAKDILAARLRAKYWGAQVITFRPFIRQILESSHRGLPMESPLPVSGGNFHNEPAAIMSPAGPHSPPNGNEEVIRNAAKGIRALVESTRAFHGIEDKRFIITNVFGTAHAQWGNLLTLAAAFKNPILSKYIDERTLRDLFAKTIAFFRVISQPSSALAIDMRILEGLERELWRKGPLSVDAMDTFAGSSFSSNTSTSGPPTLPSMHAPGTPIEGNMPQLPPIQGHR